MKTTEKDIELFDSYMNGTMDDTERLQFEERLREDEAYRKAYELHSQIVLGIQRKELKAMLREHENQSDNTIDVVSEAAEAEVAAEPAARSRVRIVKMFVTLAAAACFFFGVFIVHDAWKISSLGGDFIAQLEQPVPRGSGVEETLSLIYDDLQQGNYAEAQNNIDKARSIIAEEQAAMNPIVKYSEDSAYQLVELYRDELNHYPAHYVFAVDVSGSMFMYSDTVTKVLQTFIQALPDNDRVDIIPFGTEALPNLLSFCGVVDPQIKTELSNNVESLYLFSRSWIGMSTNIPSAVTAIANVLKANREYKVNFVVILSDFINFVMREEEQGIGEIQIEELNNAILDAVQGIYTRCIALELPGDIADPGYCLPQLKEGVFQSEEYGLEIVPLTNPDEMIVDWFGQQERDFIVNKLKAYIEDANQETEYHQQMLNLDSDELDWYQALVYAKTHKVFKAKRLLKQIAKSDSEYKEKAKALL